MRRGRKRDEGRELAADDAHRVEEGAAVGAFIRLQGRFVDQAADGEMGQQEGLDLLTDEVRGLAAQYHPGIAQMGLQRV